ncbi:MAG: hypothetical protein ACYTGG_03720 [Planctomycetota bacterium]|jgi:hypothetical protein
MLPWDNIRHNPIPVVDGDGAGESPDPACGRDLRREPGPAIEPGTPRAAPWFVGTPNPIIAAGYGGCWPWPTRIVPPPPPPPDAQPPGVPCDHSGADACRILLNEAEREIDRLRRGIDDSDRVTISEPATDAADDVADRAPDELSAPPERRPTYEAPGLGRPRPTPAPLPPPPPARVLHLDQVVTNVGSLIDRLI